MNQIKKKKYYRIVFELTSPLSVGSGENQTTDRDIVCDSRGIPYIPGSAIAGMFRHEVEQYEKEYAKYFGDIPEVEHQEKDDSKKNDFQKENSQKDVSANDNVTTDDSKDKNGGASESRVIVYDATIENGNGFVTKRDMVALDEYKTAKPGSKFDFQVLEPGVKFVTFLEQNIYDGDNEHVLDSAIARIVAGEMALGAKTRRGYGHIKAEEKNIKTAIFYLDGKNGKTLQKKENLSNNEENVVPRFDEDGDQDSQETGWDLNTWLDFDMFDAASACWRDWNPSESTADLTKNQLDIGLRLLQKGGLSVRQYSTKPGDADYMQMRLHGQNGAWVIPGTTWAGAFRAHLKNLGLKEEELQLFFGSAKKKGGFQSKISFGESEIRDGQDVIYSRNAIDRFTGGTVDGALYTESIHYHGSTLLDIGLKQIPYVSDEKTAENAKKQGGATVTCALLEKLCRALAASIVDLHEGYMAVGGLTSVGRGIFSVTEVDVNGEQLEIPYLRNSKDNISGKADAQASKSDAENNNPQGMYQQVYNAIWEVVEKWNKN